MQARPLAENGVYVWEFSTVVQDSTVALFERLLMPDERERASRFAFPHLRATFVVTRGMLRCVLGARLRCDPSQVALTYGVAGKPELASSTRIAFNVTHSGRQAAIAVTRDCSIGIDIEQIRPLPDWEQIARRYFCPEETREIEALPERERVRSFFYCWTRKEAYMKAIGAGFGVPLDSFRVTVKPDTPARLIHIAGRTEAAEGWTFQDLPLGPACAATVAYRDRGRTLELLRVNSAAGFLPGSWTDAELAAEQSPAGSP